MTRYDDLCDAYSAWAPHALAIDAIFRELPEKLRQALSEHLEVPTTPVLIPISGAVRSASYVELYRRGFDQNGDKIRELCPLGEYLQIDSEGICRFTIGIYIEPRPGSLSSTTTHYVEFTIESVDEQSAELQFAKTGHKIPIDLVNPAGYLDAATLVTTCLLEALKNPSTPQGRPIGF